MTIEPTDGDAEMAREWFVYRTGLDRNCAERYVPALAQLIAQARESGEAAGRRKGIVEAERAVLILAGGESRLLALKLLGEVRECIRALLEQKTSEANVAVLGAQATLGRGNPASVETATNRDSRRAEAPSSAALTSEAECSRVTEPGEASMISDSDLQRTVDAAHADPDGPWPAELVESMARELLALRVLEDLVCTRPVNYGDIDDALSAIEKARSNT